MGRAGAGRTKAAAITLNVAAVYELVLDIIIFNWPRTDRCLFRARLARLGPVVAGRFDCSGGRPAGRRAGGIWPPGGSHDFGPTGLQNFFGLILGLRSRTRSDPGCHIAGFQPSKGQSVYSVVFVPTPPRASVPSA